MKFYVSDRNGILADLQTRLADKLTNPRDADVWVTWQDVTGTTQDLIAASKKYYPKPVYVVQHGRGATREYGEPINYPLLADKFLCWGKYDYDRLCALGYGDRAAIVGCPLNANIKPLVKHQEKVVLFVPISTGKEEPLNIATYYELLKIKYDKAQKFILDNKEALYKKWGFNDKPNVSTNEVTQNFDIVTKLLPWNDRGLYQGMVSDGFQELPKNNATVFNLIRNVDAVVGLEEGTTEAFAIAHDVPTIIVDGFEYKNKARVINTKAATHCKLEQLSEVLTHALNHPEHLREERKEVTELEMGTSYGDATANIIRIIKDDFKKA